MAESQRRAADAQSVITPKKVAAFSKGMADLLRTGDIQFRKAFLRAFVNKVEILDGEIRVSGSKEILSATLEAGLPPPECPLWSKNGAPEGIRTPDLCLRRAALYPAELRALK
jgi:hypothetical protein